MSRFSKTIRLMAGLLTMSGTVLFSASLQAEETVGQSADSAVQTAAAVSQEGTMPVNGAIIPQVIAAGEVPPLATAVPDSTPVTGLIPMHQKKDSLYAEITPAQQNVDYIIIMTIAKGIGANPLIGGMSWDYDDNMIWQFRKKDDRMQIIRRNFRYQANPGTTESKALEVGFPDSSIIFSLPIVAKGPAGGDVIDLTPIFMSDLPMISAKALPGFSFARDRSCWAKVKGMKDNMELEVAATYAGSPANEIPTVIDSRGVSINIHYSISKLQNSNGFQPRVADERVGYFTTATKNLSKNADDGNFVRYINRWNLQKLEPTAETSLAKKPIVFWLEKSIPIQYRKPIRDGILEWNKAFEKAGYYNAVEVRQQEDNDTWDPEDVNYNTIRWSAANAGFSIGPSRVNPMTGEILDADVILDSGFITSWSRTFELYSPDDLAKKFCGPDSFMDTASIQNSDGLYRQQSGWAGDELLYFSQQMGFADTYLSVLCDEEPKAEEPKAEEPKAEEPKAEEPKAEEPKAEEPKAEEPKAEEPKAEEPKAEEPKEEPKAEEKKDESKKEEVKAEEKKDEPKKEEAPKKNAAEELKKLSMQGMQQLATHEVGHTLGLRHNFKLSSLKSFDEIQDVANNAEFGFNGSVMEYIPANIVPKGKTQGDYYATQLGKYDYWVIEYGYKTLAGGTEGEIAELKKIAARQTERELNYATDEDCYNSSSDPYVNVFDLGDPLECAKIRAQMIKEIIPGLTNRVVKDGESYAKLRSRFSSLLSYHASGMKFASRFIGGISVNRDQKGDPNARAPFVVTPAAKQREALQFLNEEVFGVSSYQFPAELYNQLAPSRWYHWGASPALRYDMDIHELILSYQTNVLSSLTSPIVIGRLADSELRVAPGEDVFTNAELLQSLTDAIFQELDSLGEGQFSIQKQAVSSTRRNLQRAFYEKLAGFVSGKASVPADFRALSRVQLKRIQTKIETVTGGKAALDPYTSAHLLELVERIKKTLDASVNQNP